MKKIQEELFKFNDEKNRKFLKKLIPNLEIDKIIGIKVGNLKKYSKRLYKEDRELAIRFLNELNFEYYEEKNLYMYLLNEIKDIDEVFERINKFLPYIDNWSTSDIGSLKIMLNDKNKLIKNIKKWITSDQTYIIRYAIVCLIDLLKIGEFKEEYISLLLKIKNQDYYVNMAISWYLSYLLIKEYDITIKYFENRKFIKFIHNKSIQKVIESNRVNMEFKNNIRKFKI